MRLRVPGDTSGIDCEDSDDRVPFGSATGVR